MGRLIEEDMPALGNSAVFSAAWYRAGINPGFGSYQDFYFMILLGGGRRKNGTACTMARDAILFQVSLMFITEL